MEKGIKTIAIILGIIIVLAAIFVITDYIIYRKSGESVLFVKSMEGETEKENRDQENTQNNSKEEKIKTEQLNNDELNAIETFLNDKENNGFILSSYKNANEIELYYIFANSKYFVTKQEEIEKYEKLTNSKVSTGLYRVDEEKMEKVIINATGAESVKLTKLENFTYSTSEDCYYTLNSDDLFTQVKCTSGTRTGDTYIVNYDKAEETGNYVKGIVTLVKKNGEDNWLFVTNEVAETNLY